MARLNSIRIQGFKSIRDQTIELGDLNVLIGANGAGKSNLIQVFELLHRIEAKQLKGFVRESGGAEKLLHFGSKVTEEIVLHFDFDPNAYECRLLPTQDGSLYFGEEKISYRYPDAETPFVTSVGTGHEETKLHEEIERHSNLSVAGYVLSAFQSWKIYHFHDTSRSAKVKQSGPLDDNLSLRPDARNLAAFLYRLRETQQHAYQGIVGTVRLAAPVFDDFVLHPRVLQREEIRLQWRERDSDLYFDAHDLSDGTLRFICLAALLLQDDLPSTILLDEPELGLHPFAIVLLAELLRSAATKSQAIVSTQSVTLINQLDPEDVIVVDRGKGESKFGPASAVGVDLESWLEEYSLGELWEKNVIGGRPAR